MMKDLDLEMVILSKLLLRGRNQHRREKYYQMLVRVSKDLKRYKEVGLMDDKLFPKQSIMCRENPTKLVSLAKEVQRCLNFTADFLHFVEETFIEVQKQLSRSLFVPTNLVVLAILSRIWYLMKYHLSVLSGYHRQLPYSIVPVSERLKAILSSLTQILPANTNGAQEDLGAVVQRGGTASARVNEARLFSNNGVISDPTNNVCEDKYISYSPTSPESLIILPTSSTIKPARRNPKTRKGNRKCLTKISVVLGGRRVWLNLHPSLAGKAFRIVSTKIISLRRPSMFSRDYTVVRGAAVMKIACKRDFSNSHNNVLFGLNRRGKDFEILQKQFARDLEKESNVAVVAPELEQDQASCLKKTHIIDEIFSVCTLR